MDLKEILNQSNNFSAKVVSINREPMMVKNGYLSDISHLVLSLENGESMNLIMKTPLKSVEDESNQVYVTLSQAVSISEFSFYQEIYPDLDQMMRDLQLPSPLPKCYYAGDSEDGPVIVLDDLSHRGLKLPSLQTEIPESDVRSILRSLAVVQATCCELQLRRKKSMMDLFPFLKNAFADMLQNLIRHQLATFKEHLAKQFTDSHQLFDLLSCICLNATLNEYFFSGKDTEDFLCHGDLWNNNIFINEKECLFIDWQGVSCGCPLGDIATLVLSSLDLGPEPSKRFELLLLCYSDFLVECCGNSAALKERVEKQVVPFLTSSKMVKLSLQFGVKWIVASFDCFLDSSIDVRTRVLRNIYKILSEMS